ncbi:hypothetical protein PAAG_12380 [Paracoccidioides lutzii Pb01]|uniref:Uncharacterized protein n=1 Tax=Paracoccidioides lutzii (strain ATCC MYA-826 / Pb01) TaxID=502779 RepID=A0A0A2V0B2_PARBA|nr:hypothetical protein PAAG_12380 [Paracoccidioides lutzii Pb01]KGQ00953.1 hypothetical protein PAAG_12380 [Paracoccidioides lutzii Pb01]
MALKDNMQREIVICDEEEEIYLEDFLEGSWRVGVDVRPIHLLM